MRKLVQIISAAVLSVMFMGVAASAQVAPTTVDCEDITIINTGDDSENTVTCETTKIVTISCENGVIVGNVSFQDGRTGDVIGTGTVNSGTVVNYNGTETEIDATCGETTTTSPTPTPSVSPTPTPSVKPTVLPFTAGTSSEAVIAMSLIAAAAVVALSRVAVAAYRHFNTK